MTMLVTTASRTPMRTIRRKDLRTAASFEMRCRVSQMYKKIVRFGLVFVLWPVIASAQDVHDHTPAVSGVPQGVPYFCAHPTVTSIATGLWSDSKIWST